MPFGYRSHTRHKFDGKNRENKVPFLRLIKETELSYLVLFKRNSVAWVPKMYCDIGYFTIAMPKGRPLNYVDPTVARERNYFIEPKPITTN